MRSTQKSGRDRRRVRTMASRRRARVGRRLVARVTDPAMLAVVVAIVALVTSTIWTNLSLAEQSRANATADKSVTLQAAQSLAQERDARARDEADAAEQEARRQELESLDRVGSELSGAGPIVSSTAWYSTWRDPMSSPWNPPPPGAALVHAVGDPWHTWLNVEVTNSGRFKATVTSLSIEEATDSWVTAAQVECLDPSSNLFAGCERDIVIEPQERATIRIPLNDDEAVRAAACNEVNHNGLSYRIDTIGSGWQAGHMWQRHFCV